MCDVKFYGHAEYVHFVIKLFLKLTKKISITWGIFYSLFTSFADEEGVKLCVSLATTQSLCPSSSSLSQPSVTHTQQAEALGNGLAG